MATTTGGAGMPDWRQRHSIFGCPQPASLAFLAGAAGTLVKVVTQLVGQVDGLVVRFGADGVELAGKLAK